MYGLVLPASPCMQALRGHVGEREIERGGRGRRGGGGGRREERERDRETGK